MNKNILIIGLAMVMLLSMPYAHAGIIEDIGAFFAGLLGIEGGVEPKPLPVEPIADIEVSKEDADWYKEHKLDAIEYSTEKCNGTMCTIHAYQEGGINTDITFADANTVEELIQNMELAKAAKLETIKEYRTAKENPVEVYVPRIAKHTTIIKASALAEPIEEEVVVGGE